MPGTRGPTNILVSYDFTRRQAQKCTQRKGGHVTREAEAGAPGLQAQDAGTAATTRSWRRQDRPPEGCGPADPSQAHSPHTAGGSISAV